MGVSGQRCRPGPSPAGSPTETPAARHICRVEIRWTDTGELVPDGVTETAQAGPAAAARAQRIRRLRTARTRHTLEGDGAVTCATADGTTITVRWIDLSEQAA